MKALTVFSHWMAAILLSLAFTSPLWGDETLFLSLKKLEYGKSVSFLKRAKFALINGDLRKAKTELLKIKIKNTSLVGIKKRYLALISFVEENYEESLKHLQDPLFNHPRKFEKICVLKIINKIALNINRGLVSDLERCQDVTTTAMTNSFIWPQTLVGIRMGLETQTSNRYLLDYGRNLISDSDVKNWLKLLLMLGKESIMPPVIAGLSEESYRNEEIRELAALVFYRNNNYPMAEKFLKGIETANSYNIQGNILLDQGKLELAYNTYKLALMKKQNSENAITRSIILAWILGLNQEGVNLARFFPEDAKKKFKIKLLRSLFMTRQGLFEEAYEELNQISDYYIESSPQDFNLATTFNAIATNHIDVAKKYSLRGCRFHDLYQCWTHLQLYHWENLALLIRRQDRILDNADEAISKLTSPQKRTPIVEDSFIDQNDIEELDELEVTILDKIRKQ